MEDLINQTYIIAAITSPTTHVPLGSAFLLDASGKFATAYHVVANNLNKSNNLAIVITNQNATTNYQDTTNRNHELIHIKLEEADQHRDLAIFSAIPMTGHLGRNISIGSLDEVNIGEELIILGYPHCVELRAVATYQPSTLGAKILLDSNGLKLKYGVLNLHARPGQSGSMVISRRLEKIVGVLIGAYIPEGAKGTRFSGVEVAAINQTTHILSAEYLRNML